MTSGTGLEQTGSQGQGHTEDPRIDPACKASVRYKSSGACDGFPNPCSMCDCFFTSEFADQERAAMRYILAAADAADPRVAQLAAIRELCDEIDQGDHAIHGSGSMDFGRGMAHASKLVRAALVGSEQQ